MSALTFSPLAAAPAGSADSQSAAVEEVLDTRGASALLQVHITTLQELARRGDVPCRKVGKDWRFLRSALLTWLQGRVSQRPRPSR